MTAAAIINLTPHTVVVETDGRRYELEPSGTVARIVTRTGDRIDTLHTVGGPLPLYQVIVSTQIDGLPEPTSGVLFLTSTTVARAAHRTDVVFPHNQQRDINGKVISCRGLARMTTAP